MKSFKLVLLLLLATAASIKVIERIDGDDLDEDVDTEN